MGALLSACGDKRQSTKRGCGGSPALRMSLGLWALPLQWSMLPSKHPLLQSSSVLSPHAVFSLPLSVCFLGWLSKLQIPAPRPCVHPQTPISGWGALGGSTNRLCRPHSVSPRPGALLFSKPRNTPSVSADPLTGEGTSPDVKILSHFQLPSRSKDLIPPPLLFLFPSAFHPAWLYGTHSFPFMCLKSSASIQQVLCENFSIFEVFLMYLWGEMNSMFSCPLLSWKVLIFFLQSKTIDFFSILFRLYFIYISCDLLFPSFCSL